MYLELKNNFHKIIDNYTIPTNCTDSKINLNCVCTTSAIGTAATCAVAIGAAAIGVAKAASKTSKIPFILGGIVLEETKCSFKNEKNSLPKFKNTNPDIYEEICNYCESKNIDEASLYIKALVSKSTFSKIRSMKRSGYKPDKSTIIRLALVLKLTLPETQVLLNKLGYVLSDSLVIDKVVAWCIEHNCYDFDKMDDILIANDIPNTLMPQGLA